MYLYEEVGRSEQTTHTIQHYNGTLATFVVGLGLSLAIPAFVAGYVAQAIAAATAGVITGKMIEITSSVTLSAKKYPLSYYGMDKHTGDRSDTMVERGVRYNINETGSDYFNERYYEGLFYDHNDKDASSKLLSYIAPNLYGSNYEWDYY